MVNDCYESSISVITVIINKIGTEAAAIVDRRRPSVLWRGGGGGWMEVTWRFVFPAKNMEKERGNSRHFRKSTKPVRRQISNSMAEIHPFSESHTSECLRNSTWEFVARQRHLRQM